MKTREFINAEIRVILRDDVVEAHVAHAQQFFFVNVRQFPTPRGALREKMVIRSSVLATKPATIC